ncbi:ABC transporter substrate-binding protein [Streptomyces cinnamoneus]|uniref:ABC transporter substrate-binding protein n=1 Tax=Streptomyces cinnamoneus TaxID=53446 RepID=A0A2G1XMQ5_STRCJ|nr:extracellular solute-binding protein [Streptomyces cinnamoneus]PHQ52535.1 ABC transporter substrate-binding protein [Streptomyces cinnamoneus]PPT16072.1 ABC transporter substrate-binding protein [Streptomyces cinnamoneus]
MPISRPRVAVASLLVLPLTLTACGSGGDGGGGGSSADGKPEGTITFQTWNLRAKFKDYFDGLVKDFERQNPGVKVKWLDQPAEHYADKLSAEAGGGTLPDVVNVSPDLSFPLAKAGMLTNLDKEKAAARFKGEYTPEAWQGNTLPGLDGSYAFPWYLNTGPLFYNKALFRSSGLDPEKPPKSYEELFATAMTMAEKSGGRTATLANTPSIEDFGRYGVQLMNHDATRFTYNEPKGVELLSKYKELYDRGGLDPQALTNSAEKSGQKFLEQKVAMNPGGAHDLETFKKNAPSLYRELGITDAPNNTGKPNMYVMGLAVNEHSAHKAAAVAFAHFVTAKENQEAFAHKVAVFPSTRGSLDDPYWTADDGTDEGRVRVASAKMLKGAVNYTPVVMSDEMKTVLKNEVAKALQGRKSPRQALDDAAAQSDKLLERG